MNQNELRCGNYVDVLHSAKGLWVPMGVVKRVGEVGLFHVHLYDIDKPIAQQVVPDETELRNLSGIPLTPEWLERAGFEEEFHFWEHHVNKVELISTKEKWRLSTDGHVTDTYIEFVHQLQNLYFALTGEELTIK